MWHSNRKLDRWGDFHTRLSILIECLLSSLYIPQTCFKRLELTHSRQALAEAAHPRDLKLIFRVRAETGDNYAGSGHSLKHFVRISSVFCLPVSHVVSRNRFIPGVWFRPR